MNPADLDDLGPNDELATRLSGELGEASRRVSVPSDGRSLVQGRVRRRRRHRRVQTGLAAVLSLVLLVGGAVVLRDRNSDRSIPVVSGPKPGLDVTATEWNGIPFLAPDGIDWWISSWRPGRTGAGELVDGNPSIVSFEDQGFTWTLKVSVGDPYQPGLGAEDPEDVTQATVQSSVTVDDREITLTQLDGAVRHSDGVWVDVDMATAEWADATGMMVGLSGSTFEEGSGAETAPSDTVLADVASKIQRVPLGEWSAALRPPDGVPDPESGLVLDRPVRLGLPDGGGSTAMALSAWGLSPWFNSFATFTDPNALGPVHLSVAGQSTVPTDDWGVYPETLGAAEGEPIVVRGVEGLLFRKDPQSPSSSAGGSSHLALSWSEGGSNVELLFPEGTTDEDAVALADSLVIIDDAQWEALLFPGSAADPSHLDDPSSTTAPLFESQNPDLRGTSILPLLAPVVGEWSLSGASVRTDGSGTNYTTAFRPGGGTGYPMVMIVSMGVFPTPTDPRPNQTTIEVQDRDITIEGSETWAFAEFRREDGTHVAVQVPIGEVDGPSNFDEAAEFLRSGLDLLVELDPETWWAQAQPEVKDMRWRTILGL